MDFGRGGRGGPSLCEWSCRAVLRRNRTFLPIVLLELAFTLLPSQPNSQPLRNTHSSASNFSPRPVYDTPLAPPHSSTSSSRSQPRVRHLCPRPTAGGLQA